ncbi:MAG: sigma-54-dependent Fis family transcriptional regulator [Cryobacterium sp.]|nr:sigma-54-dependent Fis family transcriptional regulator [Oligoflexia bacterium]
MINWEELKHIHVIRKLQSILTQWFSTEVFFVDERGVIRNFDPTDRQREWKNPLAAEYVREKTRERFFKHVSEMNEAALKSNKKAFVAKGPSGFEQVIVSRVAHGNDFYGTVYAFCYLDHQVDPAEKAQAKTLLEGWGADWNAFDQAFSKLRVLSDGERKYLAELVDLVSEEIVTYHTEIASRQERIDALTNEIGNRYSYGNMIGKSKPMQELYGLLEKIKTSESTILINGENGTGKELIAKAVHYNSTRKDNAFVTVNCSAFNENLLDSELFGHSKGSFTGAVRDKKGLFEVAHRGTLFLDEIGDMSPTMQVKLLRVLQEGTLTPVGSTDQKKVDVRVLAATNKDLKAMIEDGTFREDLYYRINVINLVVPPLRDRKEDIPVLIDHFIARGCKEKDIPLKQLAKRSMEKFYDYPWPGNIRELENECERVIVLAGDDKMVGPELLSTRIRDHGENSKVQGVRVAGKLKDALEELEMVMIKEGLKRTGWNKSRLAKELGISRAGLIMKVEKYGLDKRKLMRQAAAAAAAANGSSNGEVA